MTLAFLFDSAGFGEWFVLLAVVLVVVGPKRLPEAARKLGSTYSKLRRAAENFKRELLDMDREVSSFAEEAEKAANDALDDGETKTED
jgi:Tat protein translocase TatB subunit